MVLMTKKLKFSIFSKKKMKMPEEVADPEHTDLNRCNLVHLFLEILETHRQLLVKRGYQVFQASCNLILFYINK
jgi:hypothetical protein